ncbi:hypothetical protein [Glycomyces tritici]|uniref:Uncharacterized protein n=1 Tax=Glycomyces tritici TaxID=2665176 RepID=A0ABT7YPY9_9ACTN|nr:hypothetical protein [Glycomyces tritici]MDN3240712.1 hypothetical protein [Glycomyces tritici]
MNYHQEWADESGELSEFDLANSADPPAEADPEEAVEPPEGAVPDEVDPADAAEQRREVPDDEDERPE